MPDTLILDRRPLGRREPAVTVDLTEARDRDLIRRVERGDEEAFRGAVPPVRAERDGPRPRVARQPFLAEEIVQEAFLAVWRTPGSETMAVTIEPSSCPDAPTTDPILTAEVTA
ncbi:MAG: hypothetical protein ACXWYN_03570 [Actinomycetota bacterium]